MIIDELGLFSNDQAITATAASEDTVDLSVARDIGPGEPLPLNIQVTEAFNNLTSLKVAVEEDDNSAFSSAVEVVSATLLLADLVVGARFPIHYAPRNSERHMRLYYTVVGTAPTTGKIHAGFQTGDQTNKANV